MTVTSSGCAQDWTSARAGTQTITVTNRSGMAAEITLDNDDGAIVAEIETLGPGTSGPMTATPGSGSYVFKCRMGGQPAKVSQPVQVTGPTREAGEADRDRGQPGFAWADA